MTTFPNEEGYDELVLARDIPFRSACTRDRVGRDEFGLTQEFFAQMLGVRRPAASGTARQLHAAGLISYRCVTITDPPTPWTS